ncbi:hypothetical protein CPB83DRAFT_786637, partial [Crepidotus variabilis]
MSSTSSPVSTRTNSRFADIKFRVLIIGKANAGKTSILQRICDTTQSPTVYRTVGTSREKIMLRPTQERSEHDIHDELIFANHEGYIFHDSCGFESGDNQELTIIQEFVREKATKKRLKDRLHAIWYCVPMDSRRPSLDTKYILEVCPDKNVPVIAVFTKFDYFKLEISIDMRREKKNPTQEDINAEIKKRFEKHFLAGVRGASTYVRLEKMHKIGQRCDNLIEATADALQDESVMIMLRAVQKENLEHSITLSVKKTTPHLQDPRVEGLGLEGVKRCIMYFPSLWLWVSRYALCGYFSNHAV